jgi:hypothetical protein
MRRLLLAASLSSVMLAGCATTSADAGKGLATAWALLDATAITADTAVKAGRLTPAQAATVSADLKKAKAALTVATDAYATHATDPASGVLVATTALAEITSIVGTKP